MIWKNISKNCRNRFLSEYVLNTLKWHIGRQSIIIFQLSIRTRNKKQQKQMHSFYNTFTDRTVKSKLLKDLLFLYNRVSVTVTQFAWILKTSLWFEMPESLVKGYFQLNYNKPNRIFVCIQKENLNNTQRKLYRYW